MLKFSTDGDNPVYKVAWPPTSGRVWNGVTGDGSPCKFGVGDGVGVGVGVASGVSLGVGVGVGVVSVDKQLS